MQFRQHIKEKIFLIVSKEINEKLWEDANSTGVSRSEIIRQILEDFYAEKKEKRAGKAR